MSQVAVGAVDLAPLLEQRHDLGLLSVQQPVDRVAAGLVVHQTVGGTSGAPPPRAPLGQLQHLASAAMASAVLDRPVDQLQQACLGGRVHPARDPATQSQRPFPSTSINRTPISLSASDSLLGDALFEHGGDIWGEDVGVAGSCWKAPAIGGGLG